MAAERSAAALRLRAEDDQDLAVLSAMLQDALVPVADLAYLADERQFIFVANRFRWERAGSGPRTNFERILSGVCFGEVGAVKVKGFSRAQRDRILELLAVRAVDGAIVIDFAGGPCVRLEVERIACLVEDLGEPWPTPWRPSHPLEDV
jgi:hypothetical protein